MTSNNQSYAASTYSDTTSTYSYEKQPHPQPQRKSLLKAIKNVLKQIAHKPKAEYNRQQLPKGKTQTDAQKLLEHMDFPATLSSKSTRGDKGNNPTAKHDRQQSAKEESQTTTGHLDFPATFYFWWWQHIPRPLTATSFVLLSLSPIQPLVDSHLRLSSLQLDDNMI